MRSQLYRLAQVAEHPKTTIQVIPKGGAHAGLLGGFIIADSTANRPLPTWSSGEGTGHRYSSATVMSLFRLIDSGHRPVVGSFRDLIRKVAEERWT